MGPAVQFIIDKRSKFAQGSLIASAPQVKQLCDFLWGALCHRATFGGRRECAFSHYPTKNTTFEDGVWDNFLYAKNHFRPHDLLLELNTFYSVKREIGVKSVTPFYKKRSEALLGEVLPQVG
jgi:hypothetical protein